MEVLDVGMSEIIETAGQDMTDKEKSMHMDFMKEALAMGELALASDETPVGCVIVHSSQIVSRGMNQTNVTRNGTRHAELVALNALLRQNSEGDPPDRKPFDPALLRECILYVTVEPCIMCASLLRQYGFKKVYYGATNDRFGGTGGVLNIHLGEGVDPEMPVSGGWGREEAIMLLRRFYVQENEKAPEPKFKKNRVLKTEIEPLSRSTNEQ